MISKFVIDVIEKWLKQCDTIEQIDQLMEQCRERRAQIKNEIHAKGFGLLLEGLKNCNWDDTLHLIKPMRRGGEDIHEVRFYSYQPRAKRLWICIGHNTRKRAFPLEIAAIQRYQPSRTEAHLRREI